MLIDFTIATILALAVSWGAFFAGYFIGRADGSRRTRELLTK